MPDDAMMYWLAEAAKERREAAQRKHVHIAAEANVDQSTVSRFESHETTPTQLDAMIAAYARDLDVRPIDIWGRAIELWRASDQSLQVAASDQPIEEFVAEHIPASPPAQPAVRSAPKAPRARTAGRSQGRGARGDSRAS